MFMRAMHAHTCMASHWRCGVCMRVVSLGLACGLWSAAQHDRQRAGHAGATSARVAQQRSPEGSLRQQRHLVRLDARPARAARAACCDGAVASAVCAARVLSGGCRCAASQGGGPHVGVYTHAQAHTHTHTPVLALELHVAHQICGTTFFLGGGGGGGGASSTQARQA
jgi:hypothetical protein